MFAAGDTVTTPWREWRGGKGSGAVELKWNSDQLVLQNFRRQEFKQRCSGGRQIAETQTAIALQ